MAPPGPVVARAVAPVSRRELELTRVRLWLRFSTRLNKILCVHTAKGAPLELEPHPPRRRGGITIDARRSTRLPMLGLLLTNGAIFSGSRP